jgi:hypothetical protein
MADICNAEVETLNSQREGRAYELVQALCVLATIQKGESVAIAVIPTIRIVKFHQESANPNPKQPTDYMSNCRLLIQECVGSGVAPVFPCTANLVAVSGLGKRPRALSPLHPGSGRVGGNLEKADLA